MKKIIPFLIIFASCSIYKKTFDCPPNPGIGCKSVTDIEKMIQEQEKGPDILLTKKNSCPHCLPIKTKPRPQNLFSKYKTTDGKTIYRTANTIKRVYFPGRKTKSGNYIEGYYIYFTLEDEKWIIKNEKEGETC